MHHKAQMAKSKGVEMAYKLFLLCNQPRFLTAILEMAPDQFVTTIRTSVGNVERRDIDVKKRQAKPVRGLPRTSRNAPGSALTWAKR